MQSFIEWQCDVRRTVFNCGRDSARQARKNGRAPSSLLGEYRLEILTYTRGGASIRHRGSLTMGSHLTPPGGVEIDFIACNWQSRVLSRLGEGESGKGNRVNWKVTLSAFGLIFLAEIGDKTQLAAISMVARTKAPWAVLTGTVLALALVSLIGVLAGEWLTHLVRPELLERAAAVAFIAIGVWMLVSK